jgi:uncharacterized OB-fold protein
MAEEITDEDLIERFPAVFLDHDTKHYFRGLLHHQLLINRCADCRTWHLPPGPICPRCRSRRVFPEAVSGRGTVYMATILRQGPGIDPRHPKPVVVVELEEQAGLRIGSTMMNCDVTDVRVGAPVRLRWETEDGNPYPAFEPDQPLA